MAKQSGKKKRAGVRFDDAKHIGDDPVIVKCTEAQTLVVRIHEMKMRYDTLALENIALESRLASMEIELGSKRRDIVEMRKEISENISAPRERAEMVQLSKSVNLEDGRFVKNPKTAEWFLHKSGCLCVECKQPQA